jgi:hypothetical protein
LAVTFAGDLPPDEGGGGLLLMKHAPGRRIGWGQEPLNSS